MAAPRYRSIAPTYLGERLRPTDAEFDWDGPPNAALVPLNKEAEAAVAEYRKVRSNPSVAVAAPARKDDGAAKTLADALARAEAAEAEVKRLTAELDDAQLAVSRTTPGDSNEKLEAIEREVDEANGKLTAAQHAALDHDGDNKAGGSTPKAGRSPEEEAERAALFAEFKERGVKVFAGSTTEKLREKLAEINAG